jgi:hypothetical protein
MTVGGANKELVAKFATLSLGGVVMAAGKNWTLTWGLKTLEEYVCGSDLPRVIHAGFSGKVTCDAIYVSDDNWGALSSVRDTTYTLVSTDKDTNTTQGQKVLTVLIKIKEFERQGPPNADGVVKAKLQGTMLADPTGA